MRFFSLLAATCASGLATSGGAVTINENEIPEDYNVHEFNVPLGDGGRLVGAFVGNDVNGDRRISSNTFVALDPLRFPGNSEVALLRVEYQGPNFDLVGTYDFFPQQGTGTFSDVFGANNGGEVFATQFGDSEVEYILDGSGLIGNDTFNFFDFLRVRLTEDTLITSGLAEISLVDPLGPNNALIVPCDREPCSTIWRFEPTVVYVDENGLPSDPETNPDGEIFLDSWDIESTLDNAPLNVTSGPLGDAIGVEEDRPLLPLDDGSSLGFEFDVPEFIPANEVFFIDPDIAVGYTYEVEGTVFTSVQAPTLETVNDPNGYQLRFGTTLVTLAPGELFTFMDPVSSFEILGIETDLMLDPTNDMAFVTGIALADPGAATRLAQIPQTVFIDDNMNDGPSITPVPLPAAGLMLLSAFAGLFGLRRWRI